MKRLLAEAGSTKTQWAATGLPLISGPGMNPGVQTAEELMQALPDSLKNYLPDAIYFFGAGCSSPQAEERIQKVLNHWFPQVKTVVVGHDILAAALACCGNQAGIVGILGTGANSACFDGVRIVDSIAAPGYVFADEGGGTWLGKHFLLDFMRAKLPEALHRSAQERFPDLSEAWIVEQTYRKPRPNAFLASFVPFLAEHLEGSDYVQNLIEEGMDAFFKAHILPYRDHQKLPIHAVGSIAFVFSAAFWACAKKHGCVQGTIIQRPIDALAKHYSIGIEA